MHLNSKKMSATLSGSNQFFFSKHSHFATPSYLATAIASFIALAQLLMLFCNIKHKYTYQICATNPPSSPSSSSDKVGHHRKSQHDRPWRVLAPECRHNHSGHQPTKREREGGCCANSYHCLIEMDATDDDEAVKSFPSHDFFERGKSFPLYASHIIHVLSITTIYLCCVSSASRATNRNINTWKKGGAFGYYVTWKMNLI